MDTITEAKPMTAKQRSYMEYLLKRKFEADTAQSHLRWLSTHTMSVYRASAKIDELKAMPDRSVAARQMHDLEIGMYRVDGVPYKVQRAVHGSGYLYAKRWDDETKTFEKETGAIRKIRAEHRMSLEDAQRFGQVTGTCGHCGRTLTDETSIAAGIGPICAGKYE